MDTFLWIFCALFTLVGGFMLLGSSRVIWTGYRAASWPRSTATLLTVETKEYESPGNDSATTWEVLVRYEYWVDGQRYEGTRIHPAYGATSAWDTHAALSQRLRASRRVRVYYRDKNPASSTLAVGFYSMTLAVFFAGFLFVTLGVGIPLTADAVLPAWLVLITSGVGVGPAFYFAFTGRRQFAEGITLVD
jgi:hypothetical protein